MIRKKADVIIIGAGAAGLMCAIEAGKRGLSVIVLEKAKKAGRKILISGGGRCNFTNLYITSDAFLSDNPHFCKSALSRYTQWDFIALMEKHKLQWSEKTLGQLFCKQKSAAVVQLLLDECTRHNVVINTHCEIQSISKSTEFCIISNTSSYNASSLVMATGGPSIPKMGASDFSLCVAKQFGLKTQPFRPALVPLTLSEKCRNSFFTGLSGVSLPVVISCKRASFKEQLLITHRGLSGPAILQISSYWEQGDEISINLLPDESAHDYLLQQQLLSPEVQLSTVLAYRFPKRFALRLCEHYFENKPLKQYSHAEFDSVNKILSDWRLLPTGTEGLRVAEVSAGGIDCDELSSKTFESKKVSGLYFIGETIDVTGHLGGYNFQWAWSSGWCAGQFVRGDRSSS